MPSPPRVLGLVGLFVLLVACDGSETTPIMPDPDAGVDAGPGLMGSDPVHRDAEVAVLPELEVTPPDIPWLEAGEPEIAPPVLTPCPAGWTEVDDPSGVVFCEPWAPGAADACEPGQAVRPGTVGCAPLGVACPSAGDYADDLPAAASIVYVLPDAAPGGDGSVDAPYASLAAANVGALSPGTVVALGRGAHAGPVDVPAGVVLWGACAAETSITGDSDSVPVVRVLGADVELHNVRLGPSPGPGLTVTADGASVALDGVEVGDVACSGVYAEGAVSVDAAHLLVRDVAVCPDDDTQGRGLWLSNGSSATVRDAAFLHLALWGLQVRSSDAPVSLTVEDAVFRDTVLPDAIRDATDERGGGTAIGLFVPNEAAAGQIDASVSRTVFEAGTRVDVVAYGQNVRLQMGDVVFRGGETALVARGGASAELRRTVTSDYTAPSLHLPAIQASAILADVPPPERTVPSTLRIEDSVVIDNKGYGVEGIGSHCTIERVHFARNGGGGDIDALGGEFDVMDVRLGDTDSPERILIDGVAFNSGVGVIGWAPPGLGPDLGFLSFRGRRMSIIESRENGLRFFAVDGTSGSVQLEDILVRDVLSPEFTGSILVSGDMAIEARSVIIERGYAYGVTAFGGTDLALEDAIIRDTQSNEDGNLGRALILGNARARLERVGISGHRDLSVSAYGGAALLELDHVAIENTTARDCSTGDVACSPAGHGIGAYFGATLDASNFSVNVSDLCGIHLATGGQADLRVGEVASALIGVCLQVEPYDVSRLVDDVRYVGNDRNLQATQLPVPDPGL